MIYSFIMIGFVLAVGYLWATAGFFNALLQMAIVLVSGAVAFGLWETVTKLIMSNVDDADVQNMAWGLGLFLPFVVSLVVLTLVGNTLLRFNAKCDAITNWVGGGLCAAIAATISAGILTISIANTKQGDEFLGFKNITWDSGGSIHANSGLLFPVDRITAGLYGYMSERALSTDTPLAKWRPSIVEYANALNLQPTPDTVTKFTVKPGDVELMARYTVGQDDPQATVAQMTGDSKQVYMLDGTQMPASSAAYIDGYILQFKAGAREKNGQVSFMPGQFMLVLRNAADDQTLSLMPVAIVANAKGDRDIYGRFRFEGAEVWLGSAGPKTNPVAGLEFLIPRDGQQWIPIALYAKGQRVADLLDTSTEPPTERFKPEPYQDRRDADRFVQDGSLIKRALQNQAIASGTGVTNPADALSVSNRMFVRLNKSNLRGTEVFSTSGKNMTNYIMNGDGKYNSGELLERGAERSLEVAQILPGEKGVIVQINGGRGSALSLTEGDSADADGRMYLVDTNGQQFDCLGFIYQDRGLTHVRFTPGAPVTRRDLPSLSRSREDQKIQLVFRVAEGVEIQKYVIGDKVIATFDPPTKAEGTSQRVR